jgi:phosphatidylinositol 4-kinase
LNNKISIQSVENQKSGEISEVTTEVSCIFKVFDDIRQDCLALQIIRLFMEIFERHKLDLKLFPYKTISNRTGASLDIGGIIEVVPKTLSRDMIGKTNE